MRFLPFRSTYVNASESTTQPLLMVIVFRYFGGSMMSCSDPPFPPQGPILWLLLLTWNYFIRLKLQVSLRINQCSSRKKSNEIFLTSNGSLSRLQNPRIVSSTTTFPSSVRSCSLLWSTPVAMANSPVPPTIANSTAFNR